MAEWATSRLNRHLENRSASLFRVLICRSRSKLQSSGRSSLLSFSSSWISLAYFDSERSAVFEIILRVQVQFALREIDPTNTPGVSFEDSTRSPVSTHDCTVTFGYVSAVWQKRTRNPGALDEKSNAINCCAAINNLEP